MRLKRSGIGGILAGGDALAETAAKKDRVQRSYLNNSNASGEAQLSTNVAQRQVDGIAATLAFSEAEESALKRADQVGISVAGFNAGTDDWKAAGILMSVGPDETIAGERLNAESAESVICMDQQQGAVRRHQTDCIF